MSTENASADLSSLPQPKKKNSTESTSTDISSLPQPKKKNSSFPRTYPFPICKEDPTSSNKEGNCFIGHLKNMCVEVTDEESMHRIFTMGFFGKGSLSRSTPKSLEEKLQMQFVKDKSIKKINCPEEKDTVQDKDEEIKVVDSEEETEIVAKEKTAKEIEVVLSDSITSDDSNSTNDSAAAESSSEQKEVLQLTFEEAYFLSYGLGCLVVKDKDQYLDLLRLWQKFCELHPSKNFPVMYVAYHYFRSKGWVVRSGLKYGTDYVLYKDGPPFNHGSYAVIVKPVKEQGLRDISSGSRPPLTWDALAGLTRTCNQVSKSLVILYVIKPNSISDNKISTPHCISQFKVQGVAVNRWVPAENRNED